MRLAKPKIRPVIIADMDTNKRASSSEIDRYLAHLINEEVARGTTLTELARRSGVTAAHLSNLRSQYRGAGWKTIHGLAKALGLSLSEIDAGAREFAKTRPPRQQNESRVVYDERYPNREKAVTAACSLGLSESAIKEVQSLALKSDSDLSPEEWFDMIRAAHRRHELVRFPHEEEKERQHQEHRAAERAKEDAARGTFEERLARAKAKQQKDQG